MTTKAELHHAYVWDSDECGRENFVRAVVAEMSPEDKAEMIERHGGDESDWNTGEWVTRPDAVECKHCEAKFEARDPGEED